jgi:uncharacterized membrane protein
MPAMDTSTPSAAAARDRELNARLTLAAGLALLAGTIIVLSFAPGAYNIYLALHVIAAVVWVGGAATLGILALVADRKNDDEGMIAIGKQAEWIGMRVFTPAAFIVLAFGLALAAEGNWSFGDFWLLAGLIGWGLSAALGIFFISPEAKRLNALAAEKGIDHPETQARLRRILAISRIDLAILTLVVLDMAAKPFL